MILSCPDTVAVRGVRIGVANLQEQASYPVGEGSPFDIWSFKQAPFVELES